MENRNYDDAGEFLQGWVNKAEQISERHSLPENASPEDMEERNQTVQIEFLREIGLHLVKARTNLARIIAEQTGGIDLDGPSENKESI